MNTTLNRNLNDIELIKLLQDCVNKAAKVRIDLQEKYGIDEPFTEFDQAFDNISNFKQALLDLNPKQQDFFKDTASLGIPFTDKLGFKHE